MFSLLSTKTTNTILMLRKFAFFGLLFISCIIAKPCFADDICDEVPEDEEERDMFLDMYPFCENIDAPLDDHIQYLLIGGMMFGLVLRRQVQKNNAAKQIL